MKKSKKCIELFAGADDLVLALEQAGFKEDNWIHYLVASHVKHLVMLEKIKC